MGKGSRETSALRTLRSQLQTVQTHMELVDASLSLAGRTAAQAKDKNQTFLKALGVGGRYETLHTPARQHQGMVGNSRGLNVELALRAAYNHFLDYLRSVLQTVHKNQPLELVRDAAIDLEPWEMAAAQNEEDLRRMHLHHAFRHLEVRGRAELLLDRTSEELGLSLNERLRTEALAFLEMRNLFLYNNGMVDERYANIYGELMRVKPGNHLPRNAKLGRRAVKSIETLCIELDKQMLSKRLLKAS
jgi:hypothetical protein